MPGTSLESADLLERARADANVVGVVVVGPTAAGVFATERSDIDCCADPSVQRRAFRAVEAAARAAGLGAVVDGREPDVLWLRGDDPPRT